MYLRVRGFEKDEIFNLKLQHEKHDSVTLLEYELQDLTYQD